jgi:hypothetical protein
LASGMVPPNCRSACQIPWESTDWTSCNLLHLEPMPGKCHVSSLMSGSTVERTANE